MIANYGIFLYIYSSQQASRISLRHKSLDSTQKEVKAMENLRDKIKSVFPNDSLGFPFSPDYFDSETNKVPLLCFIVKLSHKNHDLGLGVNSCISRKLEMQLVFKRCR